MFLIKINVQVYSCILGIIGSKLDVNGYKDLQKKSMYQTYVVKFHIKASKIVRSL